MPKANRFHSTLNAFPGRLKHRIWGCCAPWLWAHELRASWYPMAAKVLIIRPYSAGTP